MSLHPRTFGHPEEFNELPHGWRPTSSPCISGELFFFIKKFFLVNKKRDYFSVKPLIEFI